MKAFVSLHTAHPSRQSENEVAYKGYCRVEVDFHDNLGATPITLEWPKVEENCRDIVTHICIGEFSDGDGEIGLILSSKPHEELPKGKIPKVTIANIICNKNGEAIGAGLPISIHPLARALHHLIFAGELSAEELHPKIYEELNNELARSGIPIIPVIRQSEAHMTQVAGFLDTLIDLH